MPKTTIEKGDLVKVVFSDGHTQEGIVREVKPFTDFGFKVEIKASFTEYFNFYFKTKILEWINFSNNTFSSMSV